MGTKSDLRDAFNALLRALGDRLASFPPALGFWSAKSARAALIGQDSWDSLPESSNAFTAVTDRLNRAARSVADDESDTTAGPLVDDALDRLSALLRQH